MKLWTHEMLNVCSKHWGVHDYYIIVFFYNFYYLLLLWKYVSLRQQLMQLEKIVVCACYAGTRTSSEHRRKLEMSGGYLLEYNNIIIT